jgi:glycosyltransferase involved in cell wall biosynthesis
MKIALLTDGITPYCIGGMQRHSSNLCKHLLELGYEVTLVHCVYNNQKLPRNQEVKLSFNNHSNLTVFGLKFPSLGRMPGHYLRESHQYSIDIFNKLKEDWSAFDIVIAKGFTAWHLLDLKRKKKINVGPIAVNFHGLEMFQTPATFSERIKSWLLKDPVKWNLKHADYVISYGGKITEILTRLKIEKPKIAEVPSGIDSEWVVSERIQNEQPVFVFLGRYERRKAIEEINVALKKHSDIQFHFIGDIPFRKRIKSKNITYHGPQTEKYSICKLLDSCDAIVSPSFSEGMPNVLLEGMARGLVPIATNVGAVQVLVNDQCGILIETPKELENAIIKFSEMSQAERQTLANASLQQVQTNFVWEKIRAKTEYLLEQMIEKS